MKHLFLNYLHNKACIRIKNAKELRNRQDEPETEYFKATLYIQEVFLLSSVFSSFGQIL